jgi:sugar/nucleoside kinase (ribokinase family)
MKHGLFVGLATLDWIYQADHAPAANEKVVAQQATMAAGGPATNAAVTFSQLGNAATVLAALGHHPLAQLVQDDLARWQVALVDLQPEQLAPPPVSSIVVTAATGERAVVSLNAQRRQWSGALQPAWLSNIDILLVDGHQMALSEQLVRLARQSAIPVVVDAGSWKPGFEAVLAQADVVIASANFQPPTQELPMAYLQRLNIPDIAITQGDQPILVHQNGILSQLAVPSVQVADTLGAGDIFHGAFCHYFPDYAFPEALQLASQVAARSCQFFGTRDWITPGHLAELRTVRTTWPVD